MKRFTNRLSPATVIACIALFVSLGGVSYGVATGSIDSRELKNNNVRSADLRNNDVRSKDIRTGNVASSDLKNNGATGTDILESSLGKVPSAANADNANNANNANSANTANSASNVGGVQVRSFNYLVPGAAPASVIFSLGGLQLTADCSGATLDFSAQTTVADTQIDSYSVEPDTGANPLNQNAAFDNDFQPGDTVDLVPDDEDNEVGSLRYSKADGGGVHVEWHAHTAGPTPGCAVNGVAKAF